MPIFVTCKIPNPFINKDFLFKRIGLFDSVHKEIGNQDHLRKIKKINSIGIFEFILNNI